MKLKHRITATIVMIAFATTSALPAATIPNLKTAPAAVKIAATPRVPTVPVVPKVSVPATPRVPVVKAPEIKVPAVKVPVTPKIISAPKVPVVKVPVAPKVPSAPRIVAAPKVPVTPKMVQPTAALSKVAVAAKVPVVRTPEAPKTAAMHASTTVKVPAKVAVGQVNLGKLKNIKERLPVEMKPVETHTVLQNGTLTKVGSSGKGSSFIKDNLAGGGGKKPGSVIDNMKANPSQKDRNPASRSPKDQMRGDKNSQASDNGLPAWMGTKQRPGTDKDGTTVTRHKDGSITVDKNGISTTLYKDGTVKETDRSGKTTVYDPAGTPVPDDIGSNGRPVFTKETAKGIQARKGGNREPTEESSGSTGPVNTGANGTGKFGSLSQPVGDKLSGSRATQFDSKGIQTRIESRINTGGR